MGYLFENAEEMDIQAERRKTKEALEKLQATELELKENQEKLREAREKLKEVREKLKYAKKRLEAVREKSAVTKEKLTDTKKKPSATELQLQMMEKYFDQVIADHVRQCREAGQTKEEVQRSLQEEYSLTEAEASEKAEKHWK